MEYTPQQKQLFKKVTGKGLGQNFVQRIASIFKGKDVEYLSPEALDTVMGVTKEEDIIDLAKGHARDSKTGEIGGLHSKNFDEMFNLAMQFIQNGSIPETRKDVFEDTIEVAMQHPYSKEFIKSAQELQSAGKDALQTVRDGQELLRSISQSNLNLSVDDFAALEVAVDGGARFLERMTSFFAVLMYPTDDEAEKQRRIEDHNIKTRNQLEQFLQDKEYEAQKAAERNAEAAKYPVVNQKLVQKYTKDRRFTDVGRGQGVTTQDEGKLKMKITKQQLINIIKEELAVVVEQDDNEKITGKGGAQTASARFQRLRQAASAAMEDEEVTAQEREVLSLIERFFNDLATTPGVDLAKIRSQLEPFLKQIKKVAMRRAEKPDAGEDEQPPAAGGGTVNVPSLNS
jgi:hypothetical protein